MAADKLYKAKGELEKLKVRVVAIVKEDIGNEIADFRQTVWHDGEVFVNEDLAFYKVFDGTLRREGMLTFVCKLFLCCDERSRRVQTHAANATAAAIPRNFVGEGFIKGGLLVVRKGGQPELIFAEDELGDHMDAEAIIAAAQSAAS
mmetsp:Transcript_58738/g.188880  ORF Transcript_58738/g.188880 Transcript_58738/m.188880 type:complete len:147 (-) Transcript_58738:125-565(-)